MFNALTKDELMTELDNIEKSVYGNNEEFSKLDHSKSLRKLKMDKNRGDSQKAHSNLINSGIDNTMKTNRIGQADGNREINVQYRNYSTNTSATNADLSDELSYTTYDEVDDSLDSYTSDSSYSAAKQSGVVPADAKRALDVHTCGSASGDASIDDIGSDSSGDTSSDTSSLSTSDSSSDTTSSCSSSSDTSSSSGSCSDYCSDSDCEVMDSFSMKIQDLSLKETSKSSPQLHSRGSLMSQEVKDIPVRRGESSAGIASLPCARKSTPSYRPREPYTPRQQELDESPLAALVADSHSRIPLANKRRHCSGVPSPLKSPRDPETTQGASRGQKTCVQKPQARCSSITEVMNKVDAAKINNKPSRLRYSGKVNHDCVRDAIEDAMANTRQTKDRSTEEVAESEAQSRDYEISEHEKSLFSEFKQHGNDVVMFYEDSTELPVANHDRGISKCERTPATNDEKKLPPKKTVDVISPKKSIGLACKINKKSPQKKALNIVKSSQLSNSISEEISSCRRSIDKELEENIKVISTKDVAVFGDKESNVVDENKFISKLESIQKIEMTKDQIKRKMIQIERLITIDGQMNIVIQEKLSELRAMAANDATLIYFRICCQKLNNPISLCLKNLLSQNVSNNAATLGDACLTIAYVATRLEKSYILISNCIKHLLAMLMSYSIQVCSSAECCIVYLIKNTLCYDLILEISEFCNNTDKTYKRCCLEFLRLIITEWPAKSIHGRSILRECNPSTLKSHFNSVVKNALDGCQHDTDFKIRDIAKQTNIELENAIVHILKLQRDIMNNYSPNKKTIAKKNIKVSSPIKNANSYKKITFANEGSPKEKNTEKTSIKKSMIPIRDTQCIKDSRKKMPTTPASQIPHRIINKSKVNNQSSLPIVMQMFTSEAGKHQIEPKSPLKCNAGNNRMVRCETKEDTAATDTAKDINPNEKCVESKVSNVDSKVKSSKQLNQPEPSKSKRPIWNFSTMRKPTQLDIMCSESSNCFNSTNTGVYNELKKVPEVTKALKLARHTGNANKKRIMEMNRRMNDITGKSRQNEDNLINMKSNTILIERKTNMLARKSSSFHRRGYNVVMRNSSTDILKSTESKTSVRKLEISKKYSNKKMNMENALIGVEFGNVKNINYFGKNFEVQHSDSKESIDGCCSDKDITLQMKNNRNRRRTFTYSQNCNANNNKKKNRNENNNKSTKDVDIGKDITYIKDEHLAKEFGDCGSIDNEDVSVAKQINEKKNRKNMYRKKDVANEMGKRKFNLSNIDNIPESFQRKINIPDNKKKSNVIKNKDGTTTKIKTVSDFIDKIIEKENELNNTSEEQIENVKEKKENMESISISEFTKELQKLENKTLESEIGSMCGTNIGMDDDLNMSDSSISMTFKPYGAEFDPIVIIQNKEDSFSVDGDDISVETISFEEKMREYKFSLDDETMGEISDELRQLDLNRTLSKTLNSSMKPTSEVTDGETFPLPVAPKSQTCKDNEQDGELTETEGGDDLDVTQPPTELDLDEVTLNVSIVADDIDATMTGYNFWKGNGTIENAVRQDETLAGVTSAYTDCPEQRRNTFFAMECQDAEFFLRNVPDKLKNGTAASEKMIKCISEIGHVTEYNTHKAIKLLYYRVIKDKHMNLAELNLVITKMITMIKTTDRLVVISSLEIMGELIKKYPDFVNPWMYHLLVILYDIEVGEDTKLGLAVDHVFKRAAIHLHGATQLRISTQQAAKHCHEEEKLTRCLRQIESLLQTMKQEDCNEQCISSITTTSLGVLLNSNKSSKLLRMCSRMFYLCYITNGVAVKESVMRLPSNSKKNMISFLVGNVSN